MQDKTIWTIGHSNRSLHNFIEALEDAGVKVVADVRSLPGSRKFPQFNKELLSISLAENNIGYVHFKDLGGRRRAKKDSDNIAWRSEAFRGYADYMETEQFKTAVEELESLAKKESCAYMCAEILWWQCHRSLISDYLKAQGWKVLHIVEKGKITEHTYSPLAHVKEGYLQYHE